MSSGWNMRDNHIHQDSWKPRKTSQAQIKYADNLFNDCGFTLAQKRDWLNTGYGSKYMDGLTMEQGGAIIQYLIAYKAQQRAGKLKL
jgi:hypothetical protein